MSNDRVEGPAVLLVSGVRASSQEYCVGLGIIATVAGE